jgi:hypothetical protein
MDATSSYQAATKIDQEPLQSAQEIYVQAVTSGDKLQSVAGLDTDFSSSDNPMAGSGGGGSSLPFQATQASSTSVTVSGGAVNLITVSDATISSITSSTIIYLDITVNASGVVTAVSIESAAALPTDTSTRAYVQLATILVADSVISTISNLLSGSLGYAYGGGTEHILWQR